MRLAQTAARPLMASTSTDDGFVEVDDRHIWSRVATSRAGPRARRQVTGSGAAQRGMTDPEARTRARSGTAWMHTLRQVDRHARTPLIDLALQRIKPRRVPMAGDGVARVVAEVRSASGSGL